MDYIIERMDSNNVYDFAKVSAQSWKESYNGIVNDDFLELINTESEINKKVDKLNSVMNDGSRRFLLKCDNKYVGILRVRITKYDNYKDYGELGALYLLNSVKGYGFGKVLFNKAIEELKDMGYSKMIIGCLSTNPTNSFYIHMGSTFVGTNPITLPNGQLLEENLYTYDFK
ncbi:MAG: GNAT family N-acetyltransferase [Bacilli bacterium]|nr:GNAT family N-acetyltransferase [Bacilli bacterium]